MSETKHTPGPWKIGRGRQDANDPVFWHVDVLNKGGTIRVARVAGVGQDTAEANARLVASSPKLLNACKEALKNLSFIDTIGGTQNNGRKLAAISKLSMAINEAEDLVNWDDLIPKNSQGEEPCQG
jgi:hypothetical protein